MKVEVCVAWPDAIWRCEVEVAAATTIEQALVASGVFDVHPELRALDAGVGIFGRMRALDHRVKDGDRIEIYRALSVDPKVARQRRVAKQRAETPNRWVKR